MFSLLAIASILGVAFIAVMLLSTSIIMKTRVKQLAPQNVADPTQPAANATGTGENTAGNTARNTVSGPPLNGTWPEFFSYWLKRYFIHLLSAGIIISLVSALVVLFFGIQLGSTPLQTLGWIVLIVGAIYGGIKVWEEGEPVWPKFFFFVIVGTALLTIVGPLLLGENNYKGLLTFLKYNRDQVLQPFGMINFGQLPGTVTVKSFDWLRLALLAVASTVALAVFFVPVRAALKSVFYYTIKALLWFILLAGGAYYLYHNWNGVKAGDEVALLVLAGATIALISLLLAARGSRQSELTENDTFDAPVLPTSTGPANVTKVTVTEKKTEIKKSGNGEVWKGFVAFGKLITWVLAIVLVVVLGIALVKWLGSGIQHRGATLAPQPTVVVPVTPVPPTIRYQFTDPITLTVADYQLNKKGRLPDLEILNWSWPVTDFQGTCLDWPDIPLYVESRFGYDGVWLTGNHDGAWQFRFRSKTGQRFMPIVRNPGDSNCS